MEIEAKKLGQVNIEGENNNFQKSCLDLNVPINCAVTIRLSP
jgi:hypothetical protein